VLLFWLGYVGGGVGAVLALAPLLWMALCWRAGAGDASLPAGAYAIGAALALPVLAVMGFPHGP